MTVFRTHIGNKLIFTIKKMHSVKPTTKAAANSGRKYRWDITQEHLKLLTIAERMYTSLNKRHLLSIASNERTILFQVPLRVNGLFSLVTIMKHLVLDYWTYNVYVLSSGRNFTGTLFSEDLINIACAFNIQNVSTADFMEANFWEKIVHRAHYNSDRYGNLMVIFISVSCELRELLHEQYYLDKRNGEISFSRAMLKSVSRQYAREFNRFPKMTLDQCSNYRVVFKSFNFYSNSSIREERSLDLYIKMMKPDKFRQLNDDNVLTDSMLRDIGIYMINYQRLLLKNESKSKAESSAVTKLTEKNDNENTKKNIVLFEGELDPERKAMIAVDRNDGVILKFTNLAENSTRERIIPMETVTRNLTFNFDSLLAQKKYAHLGRYLYDQYRDFFTTR